MMCETAWGFGYTPNDIGDMTADQIMFLLCDKDVLKGKYSVESNRTTKLKPAAAMSMPLKRRDKDGNLVDATFRAN